MTLGNFTIIFSIFLILLQLLILRKNFKIENVLQIPVSIAFGYFIDLTMYMFFWVDPQNYVVKLISLLAGCVVLGFGVYMEVLADVVMLPGESFVRAIVQTWNTNFGTTKIIFDSSMTIMAGVLSVLFFGKLNGVREGTIMAALLVGFIARLFGKYLEFVKPYIFSEDYKTVEGTGCRQRENPVQEYHCHRQGVEYSEAQHRIRKTDKYRADNYRYYTGRIWGASSNFDLTINTDFGIDFIEKYIKEALNSQQDLSPV